ncbi:MAG TPA: cbb3-type cytochrome c oxidase subunit II, partial [Rhodocyclaceae bacterium]|nr:cbb3-type cytochrome c oxidase subunit II [Rhodocyclaceae bacterium]
GSKRTGPDLQRVGGRCSDAWHYAHLLNPRDVVPESNMPAYPWLDRPLNDAHIQQKMRTLNWVGTGYTEKQIADATAELEGKTEIEALIAYLQVLGTHAPRN